ncbi:MAG: OmpH family outer membrane protein [Elusimicrobiales bacterium]|jgi:Skp family chaperone for outer membrane proteins|nr:OmpH family outer membrane protein [Elusimicrobiales bacterium]
MKKLLFIPLLLLTAGAGALELSLEENRGESGTIGYVDMDRVFREYSGTTGARDEFLAEVKKKEGELDASKKRIFALKAEISRLRQEREFAAALPLFFGEDAAAAPATEISTAAAAAPEASTSAAAGLPGLSSPGGETPAAPAGAAAPAAPRQPLIHMPGVGAMSLEKFRMSVSTSVADIEAAIAVKEKELEKLEGTLRTDQRNAEKELLAKESRKTEAILGRIYFLLRELAVSEGVSVVIDKRSILFGHAAVDLTGKLIEKLENNGNGEDR